MKLNYKVWLSVIQTQESLPVFEEEFEIANGPMFELPEMEWYPETLN